jgi:hypothetical protein
MPAESAAPLPLPAERAPRRPAMRTARRLGTLCLSALLLIWPAAWNGYPLVFSDTGTYLGQALIGYLGWDRPAFYSLFLLLTHWRLTLWLPVLAQGLITAHLLSLALRAHGLPGNLPLLLTAAGLAVLSGLPWLAAQLMPDLFTGLLVLALWLLGFRAAVLSTGERLWVLLLATGGVAVHLSHLPLALGLGLLGSALLFAFRGRREAYLGAARMLAPPLLAALAMTAANAAGHGRLAVSPFGSVFMAARVIYDGPGMAHLRRACPEAGYRICDVLDRLGPYHNAFLWYPTSPLHNELGGPKAWAPEASAIVLGTLREAPAAMGGAALANTLRQLALVATGDGLEPWRGVPGPEPLIARFFPQELERFLASRQQQGLLLEDARRLAPLHRLLALAGLLGVALLVVRHRRALGLPRFAFATFVLAAALGNAAVTGGLSGPAERYQARIAWLFVLAPALLALPVLRAGRHRAAPSESVKLLYRP